MKSKVSSLQRAIARKMFQSDVKRIYRLTACFNQFNRIKFGRAIPDEYEKVVTELKDVLPSDKQLDSYAQFELTGNPTADELVEEIVMRVSSYAKKTLSAQFKGKLESIDLKLYEHSELWDISSETSAKSPAQEVPEIEDYD